MKKQARFSLGVRLSTVQAVLIVVVMSIFTQSLYLFVANRLEKRTEQNLSQQVSLLGNLMASYHAALAESAGKMNVIFSGFFPGTFELNTSKTVTIGDKQTPSLSAGAVIINLNTDIVDKFTTMTKAVGTVFVRSGDDFVRISTSLKKEDGSRAIGTELDRIHPAYQRLLKGEDFVGKASLFGKDYMTTYVPVKDNSGKVIAALFIGLDFTDGLKALKDKIRSVKIGRTGYYYAIDTQEGKSSGNIMFHLVPSREGSNVLEAKDADGRKFISEMLKQKEGIIRYPWINKELNETNQRVKIVAYQHFKEWNWMIAGGSYLDELNAEAKMLRNAMIGATLIVVILLVLIFVFLVKRWITDPLRNAVLETELLASGDFRNVSQNEALKLLKSADEVVQLSQGIQRMALSLKTLLAKIGIASNEVSASAAKVNSIAEQIASGSEEVAVQSASVATAGEEMSATSGDIAQSCQMAAEGAQRATQAAQSGAGVVDKTVQVMSQIADKVKESAQTVESLGVRSDQIGAIIGTIEEIADQTNLLALNAAIEAARAGEQGRGFAVVADEVRALAVRTTRATHEIGTMITAIQTETRGAVAAMEQGVQQVENGTLEAAKSGQALQDILQRINDVAIQINQIATAAEEQTATTSEISQNMHQITGVVQTTSQGAKESAKAAIQLTGNAEELLRLVHQFKL